MFCHLYVLKRNLSAIAISEYSLMTSPSIDRWDFYHCFTLEPVHTWRIDDGVWIHTKPLRYVQNPSGEVLEFANWYELCEEACEKSLRAKNLVLEFVGADNAKSLAHFKNRCERIAIDCVYKARARRDCDPTFYEDLGREAWTERVKKLVKQTVLKEFVTEYDKEREHDIYNCQGAGPEKRWSMMFAYR